MSYSEKIHLDSIHSKNITELLLVIVYSRMLLSPVFLRLAYLINQYVLLSCF
jgi:hypothetical protein